MFYNHILIFSTCEAEERLVVLLLNPHFHSLLWWTPHWWTLWNLANQPEQLDRCRPETLKKSHSGQFVVTSLVGESENFSRLVETQKCQIWMCFIEDLALKRWSFRLLLQRRSAAPHLELCLSHCVNMTRCPSHMQSDACLHCLHVDGHTGPAVVGAISFFLFYWTRFSVAISSSLKR